jgi:hypothetical protein
LNFIHGDVPNLAIGTFPYTFIAGFLAPLALLLHVLSIRHLLSPPALAERVSSRVGQFGHASTPPSGN